MPISTEVKGFDELFKAMDELAEEIGKGKTDRIWRKAMTYAFEPVLDEAKALVPEDTGQLKNHIYLKVHKPQARDKASFSYQGETYMVRVTAGPRRNDSVKHTTIGKKGKEIVRWTNRPVALAQEFGTAGKPKPGFLRPALEQNLQRVQERLAQAVWYEISSGKWAKKS